MAATLKYTSRYGQNLFDICANTYGILDNYIKMLNDNSIDSSFVPSGQSLFFDSLLISDPNVFNNTTANNVFFSTGLPVNNSSSIDSGGSFDSSFDSSFEGG